MRNKLITYPLFILILFSLMAPFGGFSGDSARAASQPRPVVRYATRTDTSAPLRAMPEIPPKPAVLGEIFVKPFKLLPNRAGSSGPTGDPAVQESAPSASAPSTGFGFEGINNVNSVLPPDTVGDIGPGHYVQMVNLSYAIWTIDRSSNSATLVAGPANTNTLWQGFGGPCETTNNGDPIVLYDEIADRWMMSQFALPNFPSGPFYECIAVSQTGDPTGAWHRYEFEISQDKLNDYPKFGVWPDGYYMSINQFKCNFFRCRWAGAGVVAFERDKMLNGQLARMVYFDLENVDNNLGGMLPADLDGNLPLSGAPNVFAQIDDDAWGYSPDQIQLWNFAVDWSNPSNSTFAFDKALSTAAFDTNMCGYSRNCIPQPGGTNVDAISDRLMFRLQYRNFDGHETLVTNHTVDENGSDHAGVRWYELRDSGSGWAIHQQGTFAPDANHRWMASVAMNGAGDIGLGYSISSSSVHPSIKVTGRLNGDPLGQMTQGEATIVNGSGYQEHSSGRWGDYSSMSVDPVDDCTFWYTQEYYATVGTAPWQTHIGSFRLSDCSGGTVDSPPTVAITNPTDGSTVSGTFTVTADASDDNGVSQVEFFVDGGSIGADSDGSDGWSATWNTASYDDGLHTVSATATDTIGQTASDSVSVTVDNVNDSPVASFTYTCSSLTCNFDASASNDPDGNINSYDWDFGDGNTDSGVTVSHTYAAAGDYTVTLTVTDDDSATGTDSQTVSVSESTGMHVGDLDSNSINNGSTWTAEVTITIHDGAHNAVSSATVSGTWSNGASGDAFCTTDASGQCSVSVSGIHKRNSSVNFSVDGVSHSELSYNPGDNHDPDGDSDGTTITVPKP